MHKNYMLAIKSMTLKVAFMFRMNLYKAYFFKIKAFNR